ncbi:MAG: type II 3-dehydroquinate dehydratase [Candidatus Lightella neohaematopini]|nr:type II 3-dehydroquinate dehydratase [Candidatus Lightella neohaematopini]MCV2528678.1 type II 3-dehydroquinate dehydratase [Candidatus Lightella neohaematopini]
MHNKFNILLINGPNINILSLRESKHYNNININDIIRNLRLLANKLKVNFSYFQSNAEHKIINYIQQSYNNINFILFNPAAFTHTSIALRDTLIAVNIPFIEIHISNIYSREYFRNYSYFSDIALGTISGLGSEGYYFALQKAVKYLLNK